MANDLQSTGPILSFEASSCFNIPLTIKSNSRSIKVSALLDFGASACFINKDFAERHKLPLVIKKIPVFVKVIDSRPLISDDVVQETNPLLISIETHQSNIVFNIIKSPLSPVILGLSWLDRFNPDID